MTLALLFRASKNSTANRPHEGAALSMRVARRGVQVLSGLARARELVTLTRARTAVAGRRAFIRRGAPMGMIEPPERPRYYVAAPGRPPAVVALDASQAALVEALRGRGPAALPRPPATAWDALRAAGVPVVRRGRGHALAGKVERLADWCRPPPIERERDPHDWCEF